MDNLKLAELEVLCLDCQTTGANPARGHLLEIAWARAAAGMVSGAEDVAPTASLVALPAGATIPRRVTGLTGIDKAALKGATSPAAVWGLLRRELTEMRVAAGEPKRPTVPTVIHFARFEEPFLRALHEAHETEAGQKTATFPFELICTHLLSRRLFEELPRRGLRALSGFFGHVMEKKKRAGPHVVGTAVVWSELVTLLAEEHGVDDLETLRLWSEATVPKPRRKGGPRLFPFPRERRLALPDTPGVYRFIARGGAVLYVGKATSLQKRVNSYFQKRRYDNAERMLELLSQARDVEITVTSSPLEAALLETDEIKRLTPPYNTALLGGDGSAWFADPGCLATTPLADDSHPLGPLPNRDSLASVGELAGIFAPLAPVGERRGPPSGAICKRALGLPDDIAFDAGCFEPGLELFIDRHELSLEPDGPATLLRLGARLWREYRAVREQDAAESPQPDVVETGEEAEREDWRSRPWDAERVATTLESMVLRDAQLLRRAHFLCQLAESSIIYRPKGSESASTRRLLVIESGQVVEARDAEASDAIPLPPGHVRGLDQRRRAFDVATYDRLRVLTTELRRLVAEGAPVRVRFAPRGALDRRALGRRLWWF